MNLGTLGTVPQSRMPCVSDADPFPECGAQSAPDLDECVDTAITALKTVQELRAKMPCHVTARADFRATIDRICDLLTVAAEAVDGAQS